MLLQNLTVLQLLHLPSSLLHIATYLAKKTIKWRHYRGLGLYSHREKLDSV